MHYHLMKHIIVYFVVEQKRVYQVTTYSLYLLTHLTYLLILLTHLFIGTRTQFQRDNELSGKQHNIINHTIIEHWPSRHMDRLYDKKLLHPRYLLTPPSTYLFNLLTYSLIISQTSLESTRNTVGSIIRHDRLI